MTAWAYYNEIDEYAAQWLRNLIAAGHIAPGVVDTRSIEDVKPDDLREFTQCHFFAGIGIWSHALRRIGWPDSRRIWTGSCPCQPFSAAGKGGGFDDQRHLWPAWFHLITQCSPESIRGEQVASGDGLGWFDLVHADLEAAGYAAGAVDLCAAGVGAPHIRQRLWIFGERLADSNEEQRGWRSAGEGLRPDRAQIRRIESHSFAESDRTVGIVAIGLADADFGTSRQGGPDIRRRPDGSDAFARPGPGSSSVPIRLDDDDDARLERFGRRYPAQIGRFRPLRPVATTGESGGMADADGRNPGTERLQRSGQHGFGPQDAGACDLGCDRRPGPVNGHWRDADWLFCRDGKWRPVEPGTFPLVNGAAARVGRLRAYGNGLCADAAVAFLDATVNNELDCAP